MPKPHNTKDHITHAWVKVQNFQNPELSKFRTYNLQYALKYSQFEA